MRITHVELYELNLPLREPFVISGGTMLERRSLVVALLDDAGHLGWGESPPFVLPFYSEETLASARHLLRKVLVPRIRGRDFVSAEALDGVLKEGVRGNPFARAGLETALWDLEAHRQGLGLAALVADQSGFTAADMIECGVALGIPTDRDPRTLARTIQNALGEGYRRVKIKVAPGWDETPVRAAQDVLRGSGIPLTVDANGAYEWPTHEANLRALDAMDLLYIEQPLAPDEMLAHADLSHRLATPICLDESLRDARAAREIVALDGPKVWNLKVHRVGGLTEALRIHAIGMRAGVRFWAGTMPESGIGSQAAIAIAALPGFVYPSDVEPSARWFGAGQDVVELRMGADGRMVVPSASIATLLDRDRFEATTTPCPT